MHWMKALNPAFANMKANTTSKYKTQLFQICAMALISGGAVFAQDTTPILRKPTGPLGTGGRTINGDKPPVIGEPTVPGGVSRHESSEVHLPDLVPLSIEAWKGPQDVELNEAHLEYWDGTPLWHYKAVISVGNFGNADADWFCGAIEWKVLETTDPVNWPIGTIHGMGNVSFLKGAGVFEIVHATYCYTEGFHIPKCVKKAEVRFIVDKYFKYLGGTPEYGKITESDEDNNISEPVIIDTTVDE
jgi:hypothetical protein